MSYASSSDDSKSYDVFIEETNSKREDDDDKEVVWVSAEVEDAGAIWETITDEAHAMFDITSPLQIQVLIESSLYSSLTEDPETGEIMDFICINSAPNITAIVPVWKDWLWNHFGFKSATYEDTLFITFLYLDVKSPSSAIKYFLQNVFLDNIKIKYVMLVTPPEAKYPETLGVLNKFGIIAHPLELMHKSVSFLSYPTQKLHIFKRETIMQDFKVRKAIVEDNDDIINILDVSTPELRGTYGDFFIAKIILDNFDNQQIIVLDRDTRAVGILSLNVKIEPDIAYYFSTYISNDSSSQLTQSGSSIRTIEDVLIFAIEIFDMSKDVDERLADFLVEAIFELYPKRDYCLIGMPTHYHYFHLLNRFTKLESDNLTQELYLINRWSVQCPIRVVSSLNEKIDANQVMHFLRTYVQNEEVMRAIRNLWNTELHGRRSSNIRTSYDLMYILIAESTIVGVCLLERFQDIDKIRFNYELDNFVNFELFPKPDVHAKIKHVFMCSEFLNQMKFFLREITRLSGFLYFYFVLAKAEDYPSVNILSDMIPIRPRKRIIYDQDKLKRITINPTLLEESPSFALYHYNIKLIPSFIKKHVNSRILVVGASTTGISFLETLFFSKLGQKYWFTNITLITSIDLPDCHDETLDTVEDLFRVPTYTRKYLQKLSLPTWVNILVGQVTQIDSKRKFVKVNEDKRLQYDYLYIFAGLQYSIPVAMKHMKSLPRNLFLVNSYLDAKFMLKFMQKRVDQILKKPLEGTDMPKIIIYGCTLTMYSLINYFIELGIPGSSMIFVLSTEYFNDKYVIRTVEKNMANDGITILKYYNLSGCDYNNLTGLINQLTFRNVEDGSEEIINCMMLISFEKKRVNMNLYTALKQANIVFNGRLIIDPYYQTSDICVRAAGPITKYRAILYADDDVHSLCNSREVGADVANKLLKRIANNQKIEKVFDHSTVNNSMLVPKFKEPICEQAIISHGLHFVVVTPPGPQSRMKGHSLITGQNQLIDSHYFRLSFNSRNIVNGFTCLDTESIEVDNLINLYDKPNILLGDIIDRYNTFKIIDFFDYFNQPWLYCLYHPKFNKKILKSQEDQRSTIKNKILNFIKYYSEELPTYAHPSTLSQFMDVLPDTNEKDIHGSEYGHVGHRPDEEESIDQEIKQTDLTNQDDDIDFYLGLKTY